MRALVWSDDSQWRYGLHATPTSLALAQRLAVIEGGKHALLQPSGLSAISNVYFGLVKAGDHVQGRDKGWADEGERIGIIVCGDHHAGRLTNLHLVIASAHNERARRSGRARR